MIENIDKKKVCKVCGLFYPNFFPWGENDDSPSHDICDCCGSEFGYEDSSVLAAKINREKWIGKGAFWFKAEKKPVDWDLEQQLNNIPEEYI